MLPLTTTYGSSDTNFLTDEIYNQITKFCEIADEYVEDDQFELAIEKYQEAFSLIPEPITDWEASTWILTSIGETYFLKQDYENALFYLNNVMHCPKAIRNPLIHLRLGQVQFELGNKIKAKDELTRAYILEGEEIFEDEDPKYLNCLRDVLKSM